MGRVAHILAIGPSMISAAPPPLATPGQKSWSRHWTTVSTEIRHWANEQYQRVWESAAGYRQSRLFLKGPDKNDMHWALVGSIYMYLLAFSQAMSLLTDISLSWKSEQIEYAQHVAKRMKLRYTFWESVLPLSWLDIISSDPISWGQMNFTLFNHML